MTAAYSRKAYAREIHPRALRGLRELRPILRGASKALDRGNDRDAVAHFLLARAVLDETLHAAERAEAT